MSKTTSEWPERDGMVLRHCSNCGGEREHEISLTITPVVRRDNVKPENEKCARKPHRVYECAYCGHARPERA
ncbi:DUF7835 family putative zinc beta-ribbon protein [Halogeometricum pallidum]